jgi:cell division protein FtsZ
MLGGPNSQELPLVPDVMADRSIAIKVVGVGGAGTNVVDRLKMENLDRLRLAAINTDQQALASSPLAEKLVIGAGVTRGLGAGGDPQLGREAAEADGERIDEIVAGCDLVFLIAGMGGGTGSGAAPVVAEAASEAGALVIAFVTMPFSFEGGPRHKQAEEGLAELRRHCDAVIPLPNDMLLQEAEEGETAYDAFVRADAWIGRGVRSIWAMLFRTGLINLDFATLRQAFRTRGGRTLFGLGAGEGPDAAAQAIESLKLCPLLAIPEFARRADRLLVNIVGGTDLALSQVNEMMQEVAEQFGRDAHIVMGAVIDEDWRGRVEICVLGTSDIGGRLPPRRTAAARPRSAGAAVLEPVTEPRVAAEPAGVHMQRAGQDEFTFTPAGAQNRGHFETTERNLFEGQDLDVPTYLRRGIKISI